MSVMYYEFGDICKNIFLINVKSMLNIHLYFCTILVQRQTMSTQCQRMPAQEAFFKYLFYGINYNSYYINIFRKLYINPLQAIYFF